MRKIIFSFLSVYTETELQTTVNSWEFIIQYVHLIKADRQSCWLLCIRPKDAKTAFFGVLCYVNPLYSLVVQCSWMPVHFMFCSVFCAGFFKQSMGARNRAGIGLSYRPARLHSLVELVPRNRFLGSLKV